LTLEIEVAFAGRAGELRFTRPRQPASPQGHQRCSLCSPTGY
jgi:hypothetical protein